MAKLLPSALGREVRLRFLAFTLALASLPISAVADPSLGVPNASNRAPSGSPIEVEDCTTGQSGNLLVAQTDGRFKIVFTNEGSVTADLVRFRVNVGNESLSIRDVGKFAPGVTITHTYRQRGGNVVSSPLFAPSTTSCTVEAVHFTDGSDWTPSSGAATAATQPPGASVVASTSGPHGYLGVRLEQQGSKVVVGLVLPNAAGAIAGIKQGDVITEIEGNKITLVNDALMLITNADPGSTLHVTIERDGTSMKLGVIVGKRPQS